jgi:hypothetical protein
MDPLWPTANHPDPESCGTRRKAGLETFDRGTCGLSIELSNDKTRRRLQRLDRRLLDVDQQLQNIAAGEK